MSTSTSTPIHTVLNSLFGGLPEGHPAVLVDTDGSEFRVGTPEELDELLERGMALGALPGADDLISFVFLETPEATSDEWMRLRLEPTYVVTKDRRQIAAYALSEAVSRSSVTGLASAMECDLGKTLPLVRTPGWSELHSGTAAYSIKELTDAFCPPPSAWPAPPPSLTPGDHYRDAVAVTPIDFSDPRLEMPVVVTRGHHARERHWKSQETTVRAVLQMLSSHKVGTKDGTAYVLGEMESGPRAEAKVVSTYFVGLDIDNGLSGDELATRIEQNGLLAVMYSTHSHMKSETLLDHDGLFPWMRRQGMTSGEITREVVTAKLREKGYAPGVIASAAHTIERVGALKKVVVTHDPMPKWRVIIPLAEPYVIAENGHIHAEGREMWAQIVCATADLLDATVDKATLDVSRMFYLPRHDDGATFEVKLFGGDLLDWRKFDLKPLARRNGRKLGGSGPATRKWAAQRADGFQIAEAIRDYAPERIRNEKSSGIEIECPFAEEHSEPDDGTDTACFAANAGDGTGAGFVVTCRHNSCAGRDRLDHLNKMITDEWIEAGAINDDEYDAVDRSARPDSPRERLQRVADSLEASFPLPSSAFGTFEYRPFNGRLWAHKLDDTKDKPEWHRLFTPFAIQAGVTYADRDGKRGLRVIVQDEHLATVATDLEAGLAIKAHGAELKTRLRENGLLMTDEGEKLILKLFKQTQPTDPTTIYDRPGWRDGAFLTPWGTPVGSSRPVELNAAIRPTGRETAGNLEGWVAATKAVFDNDALHLQTGVLAGLASPVVDLCDLPTMWLAYTGSTSKGKSTSQKLSAAGWGDPGLKRGLFGSFNGTAKAAEALLESGAGAGYHFDEHQMIDGRDMQTLIFTASGGGGAHRLTRDANLRKARRWALLATLSGEVSIFQKIKASGATVTTGLSARCLDLNVEDTPDLPRAVMVQIEAAFQHYGHAGKKFVGAMIEAGYSTEPERLMREIDDKCESLVGPGSPVQHRAARIAAVLWKAGEIAQGCGLIPLEFDLEAMAQSLWAKALEADTAPGNAHDVAIRTLFEMLIARKGSDIVEGLSNERREAFGWYLDSQNARNEPSWSNGVFIVRTAKLAELAGGALDHKAIVRALAKEGHLVRNPRNDRGAWTWDFIKGIGKVQAVVIKAEAVESAPVGSATTTPRTAAVSERVA